MDEKVFLKQFGQVIKDNFDPLLVNMGFKFESAKVDQYSFESIWQKNNQYIIVQANMNPRDYPAYWNILLGEGSVAWPERDWNQVALWRFMKKLGQISAKEYSLVDMQIDKFHYQAVAARGDLEKFGESFLKGNLELFYKLRNLVNKDREPYKIYSPGKDGKYQMAYDPESEKLKKKFSGK